MLRISENQDIHGNTDGQGADLRDLQNDPLAKQERGFPRGYDHIHLGRYVGTNYVQWHGRSRNGYHYPIGRVMEICAASEVTGG